MSKAKWRFAPSEVKRALSLVREAGLQVSELELTRDGAIRIHTDSTATAAQVNPWDEVLNAENEKRAS
jgi:hypothetical protein